MATLIVYKKIPKEELLKSAKKAVEGIEGFFEKNPKRRVCKAELWYGRKYTLKKGNVEEQINKIVAELIKEYK